MLKCGLQSMAAYINFLHHFVRLTIELIRQAHGRPLDCFQSGPAPKGSPRNAY